ncbi:MAG: histidine phosphatase family protein [Acidimicrobiales bacterium]
MTSYPQPSFLPMPGTCQVILVRHGQSMPYVDGQPFDTHDGHGDPALSPRGHWQAQLVADRLAGETIGAIYVSTLVRTHETAAPLATRVGMQPQVEADLREVFLGEYEAGLFRKMSAENHPLALEMRRTAEWGVVPGAESNEDLRSRTVPVIERLAKEHVDELIVVVCHGGVIGALVGHVFDQPARSMAYARNGSITHLVVTDDHWQVRSFNDAAHIGDLTADWDAPEGR